MHLAARKGQYAVAIVGCASHWILGERTDRAMVYVTSAQIRIEFTLEKSWLTTCRTENDMEHTRHCDSRQTPGALDLG